MAGQTGQKLRTGSNTATMWGLVPVGGVVGWMGTMTGVPALGPDFVQANGQKITDTQSPMFGQTLANLNSGSFLQGGSTSGSIGGATSQVLTLSVGGSVGVTVTGSLSATSFTYTTGVSTGLILTSTSFSASTSVFINSTGTTTVATLPPFYTTIWSIRIK